MVDHLLTVSRSVLSPTDLPRLREDLIEKYTEQGYWEDRTYLDHYGETLQAYPDHIITDGTRTLSFAEFDNEVNRVAAALQARGFQPGDVLAFQLPNRIEGVVITWAVLKIGGIVTNIVHTYRESEVAYLLDSTHARCLFIQESHGSMDYVDIVRQIASDVDSLEHVVMVDDGNDVPELPIQVHAYSDLREADPDALDVVERTPYDMFAYKHTSGTTGPPKGVISCCNQALYDLRVSARWMGATPGDETVHQPSPIGHSTGFTYGCLMPFVVGTNLVLQKEWDPDAAIELIDEYQCTISMGATPFLKTLLDAAPADWTPSLKAFGTGGATIPPELIEQAMDSLDATIFRAYGSTEYKSLSQTPPGAPPEKRVATDGKPHPGVHLKITNPESGEEVAVGETGEILAHGPDLMLGYDDSEANEASFDGDWYRTGDIGYIDRDGYLTVTGRVGDMIIRGGENIPVKQVEDLLFEHPSIDEVAIVAMPDPDLQERGCAFISEEGDADVSLQDVVEYLEAHNIQKKKFPERVEVIETFPTTEAGSIKKRDLRQDIADKLGMDPVHRE